MSSVLYYSNMCKNSQDLLQVMKTNELGQECHFICIDNRTVKNNNTYIILQNQQEVLLPNVIDRVPALLLLNDNYKVLFGSDILNNLRPPKKTYEQITHSDNNEPSAYSLTGLNDIVSDTYSFLDQSADDLSAKGGGGLRQLHQYSELNTNISIETPEENYKPNTIGNQNIDVDQLQQQRNNEINFK